MTYLTYITSQPQLSTVTMPTNEAGMYEGWTDIMASYSVYVRK